MARFIKKITLFALVIAMSFALLALFDYYVIGSRYNDNYDASLADKVDRLKSIDGPKIVLVGDSNVAFGFNSKKMEEELGMPVVNCGLHGALGNAFHEQIAKINIGSKGGIVIICHTSFSDTDEIVDPAIAWLALDYNKKLYPIIREKDYKRMALAYPNYLRSSYTMWLSGLIYTYDKGCYSRSAFNEYGDVVYKPEYEQMDTDTYFAQTSVTVPEINDVCVDRLNELNTYLNSQGAKMVVAGYPIPYGKYAEFTEDDFKEFKRALDEELDCDIISDYTDYFYPYDYFYNSSYHLTNQGAEARTDQLISDIKKWLGDTESVE